MIQIQQTGLGLHRALIIITDEYRKLHLEKYKHAPIILIQSIGNLTLSLYHVQNSEKD